MSGSLLKGGVLTALVVISIGIEVLVQLTMNAGGILSLLKEPEDATAKTINGTTNSTLQESSGDFASLDRTNWFESPEWSKQCIHVEHVCHSTARWWYKPVIPNSTKQPKLTFVAHNHLEFELDYPKKIIIEPESDVVKNMTCPYSSVPNHLVLHSLYDQMLGEFYGRIIIGLNLLLEKQQTRQAMMESTQVYLQLFEFDRKLLDSHHAFIAPFLAHRLLDFKELLQSPTCSCLERLVFCGYDYEWHETTKKKEVTVKAGIGIQHAKFLAPGQNIYLHNNPDFVRSARKKIRQTVILDNPFVQQDIESFRRKFLESRGVRDSFDEWKIVGLAQRTGRRRWTDATMVQEECDNTFRPKKILCMVVNVEDKAFHPVHHAVVHGSLDALIGIHGAQLTDALWMKPGAVVVEVLFFLLKHVTFGQWGRAVTQPTPVGAMYTGTDLYHVGFPLQSDSITDCQNKVGEDALSCVDKYYWGEDDFSIRTTDILDIIDHFVDDRPTSCDDQKALSGDYRFVLYNVQCDDGTGMKNHHFYWDKDLTNISKFSVVHAGSVNSSHPS